MMLLESVGRRRGRRRAEAKEEEEEEKKRSEEEEEKIWQLAACEVVQVSKLICQLCSVFIIATQLHFRCMLMFAPLFCLLTSTAVF